MNVKQVIVIRKDLKMRRGKEIAQGAHAAMAWLIDRMRVGVGEGIWGEPSRYPVGLRLFNEAQVTWVQGLYAKVTLQVNSEAALDEVYAAAKAAGLEVHLITDAGATEFHGVPTRTCLAIGPDESEKIDPITKHLSLY